MNPDVISLDWGYIHFGNNEMTIVSTVVDPPKFKLYSSAGISLGAWAFGRMRPDGVFEEMVLLQGKQDERTRANPQDYSGELTVHIRNGSIPGDAGFIKVLEMRHDGCWMKGLSAGGPDPSPAPPPPVTLPPPPPLDPELAAKVKYFTGPNGELDFEKIRAYYGFASDDVDHYLEGDMTAVQVIMEMDRRKAGDAA